MTWKTSALAWSGMTVLAGWLASSPVPAPGPQTSRATGATGTTGAGTTSMVQAGPARATRARPPGADAGADVAAQAARLHAGLQAQPVFEAPARNPFRFREAAAHRRAAQAATPVPVLAHPGPAVVEVQRPTLVLAGIAEETEGATPVRTAVISAPGDVLLAKEGDVVAGYRVTRIGGDHVELRREADGAGLRLTLRP